MSVDLCIKMPNNETEFLAYAPSKTVRKILVPMGRALGHRWTPHFFDFIGIEKESLVEVIKEIGELRETVTHDYPGSTGLLDSFDRVVARLTELQSMDGWQAHFS